MSPQWGAIKEVDLAAAVVVYLRDLDWDVHQEVGGAYGARADIVAVRGPLLLVVETKQTLGLALLAQAHHWLAQANLVYVAVPRWRGQRHKERGVAERILRDWGVGLLMVSLAMRDYETTRVIEEIAPRLWRRIPVDRPGRLRDLLNDGTRTFAKAGNNDGKFWSAFKDTCQRVREVAERQPGLTTRELVAAIGKHHYATDASARGALVRWLAAGKIPGVRGEGERPVRWYPGQANGAVQSLESSLGSVP